MSQGTCGLKPLTPRRKLKPTPVIRRQVYTTHGSMAIEVQPILTNGLPTTMRYPQPSQLYADSITSRYLIETMLRLLSAVPDDSLLPQGPVATLNLTLLCLGRIWWLASPPHRGETCKGADGPRQVAPGAASGMAPRQHGRQGLHPSLAVVRRHLHSWTPQWTEGGLTGQREVV